MAVVSVKINGREYHLACDDGQEEHLRLLACDVDERVRGLVRGIGGNIGEVMGILLTAITMADELAENKKEINMAPPNSRQLSALLEGQGREGAVYTQREMAETLNEIAQRIEMIAERIEMR